MSGMDRLLPCPFCGNDGTGPIEEALHIMFSELDWREDAAWSVQCDECTATMGYSDSEDDAIAAWNRRASQAAPAPSDGLREAVAALQFDSNELTGPGNALRGGWMLAIKAVLDLLEDRAVLSTSSAQEVAGDAKIAALRAALSASPAQEGERT